MEFGLMKNLKCKQINFPKLNNVINKYYLMLDKIYKKFKNA